MELTAGQRAAVDHEGPHTTVVGGPATGKTTVLMARYLRLLSRHPASRVLVLCRDRGAASRFVDQLLVHLRGGFESLPVTTIHGLAYELVARASGAPPGLISSRQRRALIGRLLAGEAPGSWPLLGRYLGRPAFAAEVAAGLSHRDCVRATQALAAGTTDVAGPWAELAAFAPRYEEALAESHQVDAGGLLARAVALAPSLRPRFDHVLVDDAGALGPGGQALLAAVLSTGIDSTLTTESGSEAAAEILLDRRWRASPPGRLLWCGHPSMEAEAVAGALLAAHGGGVPWPAMAVLVRSMGHRARAIARALTRHGIPVVPDPTLAGDEPVAQAVLDMLAWTAGDEAALDRLVLSPLGSEHLASLRDHLLRRGALGDTPADLAYEVWSRALADQEGQQIDDPALDAVVALIDGLARYVDRHPRATLPEVVAAFAGDSDESEAEPDPWRIAASTGGDGVTISSIAAAAGREWHTVLIAGCVEGELPRLRRRATIFDTGAHDALADERRLFDVATSRATTTLLATAAPEPGVLLSRLVEGWPEAPVDLPLAPGQPPPRRRVTTGAAPVHPDGRLTLSATQLETYDDCPLRYAFQYVLRARDEPGVHAALGTLAHEILADFLGPDGPPERTLDSLLETAERRWRDDIARYRPQVEEVRRDLVAMLRSWWDAEGGQGQLAPEVLMVERGFDIKVGAHRLTGSIDRIDRADGGDGGAGIRVVDYKTGKREPTAADVADNLQLAVYHLAATRDPELAALGSPTQLQLRYLRTMRAFDQPVTANHAQATEARVGEVAEQILAEAFEPAVDANCRTCSFHRLCPLQPAGRHVEPEREP